MHICLVSNAVLPVVTYGGTERVIWDLAKALSGRGHAVSLLAPAGSECDFATVIARKADMALASQIPGDIDVVHFHSESHPVDQPYVVTQHGNVQGELDRQSIFVSRQHAANHGSECFVHNGLDWSAYPAPRLGVERRYFHFLGKAAWRVKNLSGAIAVTRTARQRLVVMGGKRFEVKMGLHINLGRHVRYLGMVGNDKKAEVMQASRGLVFPVTWHEPFGLAVIESLFYGCPVFATPYGALPELIPPELGVLSRNEAELAMGLKEWRQYDPGLCHEHAVSQFGADRMAKDYLSYYQRVIDGETLNPPLPPISDRFRGLPWDKVRKKP